MSLAAISTGDILFIPQPVNKKYQIGIIHQTKDHKPNVFLLWTDGIQEVPLTEILENNPDSEIQIFRPSIWKTEAPSYIIKKQKHQLIYFIKTLQSLGVKSLTSLQKISKAIKRILLCTQCSTSAYQPVNITVKNDAATLSLAILQKIKPEYIRPCNFYEPKQIAAEHLRTTSFGFIAIALGFLQNNKKQLENGISIFLAKHPNEYYGFEEIIEEFKLSQITTITKPKTPEDKTAPKGQA